MSPHLAEPDSKPVPACSCIPHSTAPHSPPSTPWLASSHPPNFRRHSRSILKSRESTDVMPQLLRTSSLQHDRTDQYGEPLHGTSPVSPRISTASIQVPKTPPHSATVICYSSLPESLHVP